MVAVVGDGELALDQFCHALGGPDVRPVSVLHGTFEQVLHKAPLLFGRELGRTPGGRPGFERVRAGAVLRLTPARDAAGMATHTPCHFGLRMPLSQEGHGTQPTAFQLLR